jgi:hypothetical protein
MRWRLTLLACLAAPALACGGADDPEQTADSGPVDADDTGLNTDNHVDTDAPLPDDDTDVTSSTDGSADTTADTSDATGDTAGPDATLTYELQIPADVVVGQTVRLEIAPADGITSVNWNVGTRAVTSTPDGTNALQVTWNEAGRYSVVAQVRTEDGRNVTLSVRLFVAPTNLRTPNNSAVMVENPLTGEVAVVVADAGELTRFERDGDGFSLIGHFDVCPTPRTVAWTGDTAVVTCQTTDQLSWVEDVGATAVTTLQWGCRPFGVITTDDAVWVTCQGTGTLLELDPVSQSVRRGINLGPDPRGLAELPDGRIAVSRWRATEAGSTVYWFDPATDEQGEWLIEPDVQIASDTETPGVLGYLSAPLVAPAGNLVAVTGTQANIVDGLFRDGEALVFDTTLRAAVTFIDPDTGLETGSRKLFDSRGLAETGAWNPTGDFLGVLTSDARTLERLDAYSGFTSSGTMLDVGYHPDSVLWTRDGELIVVHASLSRELRAWRADTFPGDGTPIWSSTVVSEEPLAPEILRGKILFNDSFDTRLSRDSYVSCSGCHLDGEADLLTWDFTDRNEGIRNTISLLGRAAAHGPIHWSGNFDEIHDFENDIRGHFGGTGLMTDEQFNTGTRASTLGDSKAGISADLDALAAYVASLDTWPRSPFRTQVGELTDSALRGEVLFQSDELGCTSCHSGPNLTDSQFLAPGQPLLHDVGTLTDASGQRLGGELSGIDTPTLFELFNSAPYLHDGSMPTLLALFDRSGDDPHALAEELAPLEFGDLIQFLLSLDDGYAATLVDN